ncbi:Bifunctional protein FolD [Bienertia sinuspersici]
MDYQKERDKLVESSSKTNSPSASVPNMNMGQMASYSHQPNQMDQNQRVKCQVLRLAIASMLTSKAKLILEQNVQALNQINSNMSLLKLQDNIDLFCRTRDNINNVNAILNDMRELSGKIGQMQELPLSIDQNLADIILPRTNSVAFHFLTDFTFGLCISYI